MKISFVIPTYNSHRSLPELFHRLMQLTQKMESECIFVDDASTDFTPTLLANIAKRHKNVHIVLNTHNLGQHPSLFIGIKEATGDILVCLDDDLQNPPEEAIKLITMLQKTDKEVVYGQYETNQDLLRRWGTKLNNVMASVLFKKPKDVTLTSFFAMKKSLAQKMVHHTGYEIYIPALVLQNTDKITGVAVAHDPRKYGTSTYTWQKLISLWLTGIKIFFTHSYSHR